MQCLDGQMHTYAHPSLTEMKCLELDYSPYRITALSSHIIKMIYSLFCGERGSNQLGGGGGDQQAMYKDIGN